LGTDDDPFQRSVLVRMPLKELSGYQKFTYRRFTSTEFSLKPTFDGDKTVYAACHKDTRTLRILAWPEDATSLTAQEIPVQEGTNGPFRNAWGDYLSCLGTNQEWLATGMTLHGGALSTNMVPRVVQFTFNPEQLIVREAPAQAASVATELESLRRDVEDLKKA